MSTMAAVAPSTPDLLVSSGVDINQDSLHSSLCHCWVSKVSSLLFYFISLWVTVTVSDQVSHRDGFHHSDAKWIYFTVPLWFILAFKLFHHCGMGYIDNDNMWVINKAMVNISAIQLKMVGMRVMLWIRCGYIGSNYRSDWLSVI